MTYSFNDSFRREVANRCAAFLRLPENDSTRGLKHSAVAIAITDTEDGSGGAAFLMTRRTRDLRAHRNADRKSTRLNSSHTVISYAVFCLKKKKTTMLRRHARC